MTRAPMTDAISELHEAAMEYHRELSSLEREWASGNILTTDGRTSYERYLELRTIAKHRYSHSAQAVLDVELEILLPPEDKGTIPLEEMPF